MLTALETEAGPAYIDMASVQTVSAPFTKKNHAPARSVGLAGGHRVFVLDNDYNREVLKGLIPPEAVKLVKAHEERLKAVTAALVGTTEPKAAKPRARRKTAASEP